VNSNYRANPSTDPLPGERHLVRRAQSGDTEAFARLYDGYVDRIYRYAYFRVPDDQTAEDITAQVFLKTWENLERYKAGKTPFLGWLYTIARNTVIDYYRTRKETVPLEYTNIFQEDPTEAIIEQIDLASEVRFLRMALQSLTEDQQQVLTLKFITGLNTAQVAQQMGKRLGAIRALQMRALQALAKYLEVEKTDERF
jgi:RNA polymerase sigma-70 factor (ECF subfamily)